MSRTFHTGVDKREVFAGGTSFTVWRGYCERCGWKGVEHLAESFAAAVAKQHRCGDLGDETAEA